MTDPDRKQSLNARSSPAAAVPPAHELGPRAATLWIVGLLMLGAALRFLGLAAGLRHTPHIDERCFVEAVAQMIAAGDLDHRFYQYPGFFFYVLSPALTFVGAAHTQVDALALPAQAAPAYLAGRIVAATFGVTQILLVFWFGVRTAGRYAALVAAALVAVSPVAVHTAHAVRPDTLLSVLALLALIAFQRLGADDRGDLLAGALVGAACATKFTGLFLAPVYVAARLLTPGAHWRKLLLAGLASLATFTALSPYAIVRFSAFTAGAGNQIGHHYSTATSWLANYLPMLAFYAETWPGALGRAAALFALAGLALTWRRWRVWLPLWIFPLVTLLVMATAYRRFARHLLPSLPIVALLAGVAVAELSRHWRRAALAVALALPLVPLSASLRMVAALARPGPRDVALDWIAAHAEPGARILTTLPELGFGRGRFEVLRAENFGGSEGMLAREADLVVTTPADDRVNVAPFPLVARFAPQHPVAGPIVEIRDVPAERRRTYRDLTADEVRFASSDNADGLALLCDGRLDTAWETARPQVPRMWLELRFSRPLLIGAVDLYLGSPPNGWGRRLGVFARTTDGGWHPLRASDARAPVPDQYPVRPATQRLLFPPTRTAALRIVQVGRAPRWWRVAELRVQALAKRPVTALSHGQAEAARTRAD